MKLNKIAILALATLGMGANALADGRNPGSLLLYPEFDNRAGDATVVTVTNVNNDVVEGSTYVHFIYLGAVGMSQQELDCQEFDRSEFLTPNDTFSVITKLHNPQQEQGYLYVYARNAAGEAIPFDYLIGNLLVISGIESFEYSVNPVAYSGIGDGVITDIDGDNIRDLNGVEYEQTPETLMVPRFLGQDPALQQDSKLILIGLSGGKEFTTTVDFLIYNDNEDQFSANYKFDCWEKAYITDVSGVFAQDWLENNSGQNEDESLGSQEIEYGWFKFTGGVANSSSTTLLNPAVYGVYIEDIRSTSAADLPFESGLRNGHLFPRSVSGDNEEPDNE